MKHCLKIIITIILFTAIISGCTQDDNNFDKVITNENIIHSKKFYVNSDSTELVTSVSGTVFLSGVERVPNHAQIVAFFEIDPNDWGGVIFYIHNDWHISSITSSYPEGNKEKTPKDYVATWTTADTEKEWNTFIEIGSDRSSIPTGGGKGAVVIELDANKETNAPNVFNLMVGVGSKEKDGIRSRHPDYERIEISLP